MQLFALTLMCAALAAADVSHVVGAYQSEGGAHIVSQSEDVGEDGTYAWEFESDNGIRARAQGALRSDGQDGVVQVVQGDFSYKSPDGQTIKIQYVADENGYRPQGEPIPTPPPIPEAILRALEYNAAHPSE